MRKLLPMVFLAVLFVCNGCTEKVEDGSAVSCRLEKQWLTDERQEVLVVSVKEDCEATMHISYSTDDQNGAVLWLENDGRELLMDELTASTEEAYESLWMDSKITLLAGDNVFSLSAPSGEKVPCTMTLNLEGVDLGNLITENMDPHVIVKDT